MTFSELMNDTVSLLKVDGIKIDIIKASVQHNKIYIDRSDILIETDDLIQRKMSNGGEETYKVIDPGFNEKFGHIPAGYQLDVVKLGVPEAKSAVKNITYNITGHNTHINQNSIDNSTNILTENNELKDHILALRQEVLALNLSDKENKESNEIIDAIESQFANETPNKTVVNTLLKALPKAASIASIGSFILSWFLAS